MSEKVKLIIEIPKYYLEHPQDYTCLAECVRRGTPLDTVRAEIRKAYVDVTTYSFDEQVSFYAQKVNKILDNIGNEKSPRT